MGFLSRRSRKRAFARIKAWLLMIRARMAKAAAPPVEEIELQIDFPSQYDAKKHLVEGVEGGRVHKRPVVGFSNLYPGIFDDTRAFPDLFSKRDMDHAFTALEFEVKQTGPRLITIVVNGVRQEIQPTADQFGRTDPVIVSVIGPKFTKVGIEHSGAIWFPRFPTDGTGRNKRVSL